MSTAVATTSAAAPADRARGARLRPGRRLRRAPARRQSACYLHRCSRPLDRRDAGARARDQPLRDHVHPARASLRSNASVVSRSASSPSQEELRFAGHPTLGTASWLYWNHPALRGAEQIMLDLRSRPHPRALYAAAAGRARRLRNHAAERPSLRRDSRSRRAGCRARALDRRSRSRPARADRLDRHGLLHCAAALA